MEVTCLSLNFEDYTTVAVGVTNNGVSDRFNNVGTNLLSFVDFRDGINESIAYELPIKSQAVQHRFSEHHTYDRYDSAYNTGSNLQLLQLDVCDMSDNYDTLPYMIHNGVTNWAAILNNMIRGTEKGLHVLSYLSVDIDGNLLFCVTIPYVKEEVLCHTVLIYDGECHSVHLVISRNTMMVLFEE